MALSESRCDKDLDTLSGYALCLPNLARLQTYHFVEHRPILCVEIKVNLHRGEDVGEGERGSVSLLPGAHFAAEAPGVPMLGLTAPSWPPTPLDSPCFLLLRVCHQHLSALGPPTGQTLSFRPVPGAGTWSWQGAAAEGIVLGPAFPVFMGGCCSPGPLLTSFQAVPLGCLVTPQCAPGAQFPWCPSDGWCSLPLLPTRERSP